MLVCDYEHPENVQFYPLTIWTFKLKSVLLLIFFTEKWRRFYQEGWHWWWWVVMESVWSDLVDIGRAMGVGLSGAGSLIYVLWISDWWCIWNLIIIYLSPISIWAINIIIEVSESSLKVQKKYCYVSVCISFWVSNF